MKKYRAPMGRALQSNSKREIRRSSRKLKQAVTIFSAIVVLGTVLLLASVIYQEHKAAEERAWNDIYNLSGAFENQVHSVMENLRDALSYLKPRLAVRGADFDLVSWAWQAPEFTASAMQVSFVGPDGKLLSSSLERDPKPIDLSDREHIRVHMMGKRDIFIGKPVQGRVSKKITIQVSDRVEKLDGTFAGVIVFSLSPDFLTSLHRSVRLGRGGIMILAGTDGIMRACYGESRWAGSQAVGKPFKSMQFLDTAGSRTDGFFADANPLNGRRTFYSWRKVGIYPVTVIVGRGERDIFSSANRSAVLLSLLGIAVIALTVGTACILRREIDRRVRREIALFEESRKVVRANSKLRRRQRQLLAAGAELNAERTHLETVNAALSEAKEIADRANQAKTSLLMNMSHEFRTPMHAILNYTSMGLKKLATNDTPKLNKYLSNIQISGNRLLKMLNALLDLAKLESGRLEMTIRRGDLLQVVHQAQTELESLLEAKRLRLKIDSRVSSTDAIFDQHRLMQVFINLLSNALKFSPECGLITITIVEDQRSPDAGLKCTIEDQGPGIPESEREKIFDKFVQGRGKVESAGGTGLGLAICREIIHLHGGKIWAANKAGAGATIHFTLPGRRSPKQGTGCDSNNFSQIP